MLKRLWIGFVLAFVLGIAVEFNRGNPPRTEAPIQVEDESGRRLLLLIIDTLSIPNYQAMPALQGLAKDGFYADVEPCLERITYVCVKESLTGRTAFTLFGLFQNFGVGATDPGGKHGHRVAKQIYPRISSGENRSRGQHVLGLGPLGRSLEGLGVVLLDRLDFPMVID